MTDNLVVAKETFWLKGRICIEGGWPYREDDPLVQAKPHMFLPIVPKSSVNIEAATAAPGEKRSIVRRTRKKSDDD